MTRHIESSRLSVAATDPAVRKFRGRMDELSKSLGSRAAALRHIRANESATYAAFMAAQQAARPNPRRPFSRR